MYYGGSRSPSSYNGYGKGFSYNYSSDLSLSSLSSRNPTIQRVLNSDYGISERSRSPVRDYGSSTSRFTSFRPLPGVGSGDTSPTPRRRDVMSNESISSPVSFLKDDLSYATKTRNYYDFPSTSGGLFSYSTTPIKKPKRIDYTDYFRPVLTDRPTLKSGYLPRSRAERENVSTPIVRERKLIKFRETPEDVLEKIRRKISWDLPDEISSSLIDEMKQKYSESLNENCVPEQVRSRENSLSRRGSKDIAPFSPGSSPLSGSPRPSISRRSSGDQGLDSLSGRPLVRKHSSRSNSLIGSSIDGIFDTFDSKPDDMNVHSKVPIPPPRKKSIGSTHKVKKRKSSIDILLSEEKTLNYSKVADDIRRSREISESSKKLANEATKDNQLSESGESETAVEKTGSNILDNKQNSNSNELKTIEESSETVSDRGRRRRRRESIPEPSQSEEQPPESRRRCRSRFRPDESTEVSNSSEDSNQKTVEKIEDETPRPVSRMHRKSVKYKPDGFPPRHSSKASDPIPDSPMLPIQKTSSTVEAKDKPSAPEVKESNRKTDLNKIVGKEVPKTLSKQNLSSESKTKPENDQKKILTNDRTTKSKFDQKEIPSSAHIDKKSTKTEGIKTDGTETTGNKSAFETKAPFAKNFSDKTLKLEKEANEKISIEKPSKLDGKILDAKKSTEKTSKLEKKQTDVKTSLDKQPKIDTKITDVKSSADKTFKTENRETDTKFSMEKPSKTDPKLPDIKKSTDTTLKIEKKGTDENISLSKRTDTKIQDVKNSLDNKISKTLTNESDTKFLSKKPEDIDKKLSDLNDLSSNKGSEIKNRGKDSKSILNTDISKLETKSDFKSLNDNLSKIELNQTDLSSTAKKPLKTEYKKSDAISLGDNSAKIEKKEANLKLSDHKTTKEELRKSEEKSLLNEKIQNTEEKNITSVESVGKSLEAKTQKEPIASDSKSKLPENKVVEEIVVVCKLPKKNDLNRKKSIPNEQNVVVSIKNSALKTDDVAESSSQVSKSISPTVLKIIPRKQSMDSKLENCDSLKNQETCIHEEPEINVTHTIVLKRKTQNKSVDVQRSRSNEKIEKDDNVRLKPIPDVIKSTVNSGAKADSDISDIVKSTLPKGDDQSKMKGLLPDIKNDVLTKNDKDSLSSGKTQISNEKLSASQSLLQEKNKSSELKQIGKENLITVSKETISTNDLPKVQKCSSAVFDNYKDEAEVQHTLKVKKSSSAGFDNEKDQYREKSGIKPDLIQMTAKTAEKSDDKSLPNLTKEAISSQHVINEKKNLKVQNDKPMPDKSASDEFKTLQLKNKSNDESNLDSASNISKDTALHSNSSEMLELGVKGTTMKDAISKDGTLVSDKTEPPVAKSFEGKNIDTTKPNSEKIDSEVKSTINKNIDNSKDKLGASEPLRVLKSDSSDIMNNREVNDKISENKIKPIEQKLEENKISLPKLEMKKDIKKEEDNLKNKLNKTTLLSVENEIEQKRNAAPAYKKSMTVPDFNSLLEDSNSKEKPSSVINAQIVKKTEPASLSTGNVPGTLQGEKKFVQNKDTDREVFKLEAIENLKTEKISSEICSDSDKNNELQVSNKLQLPKIGINDVKSAKEDFKSPKDVKAECNSSAHGEMPVSNKEIEKTTDKEASRTDQRESLNKKEKLKPDTNLKLKTEDVSKCDRKAVDASSPVETRDLSKALHSTVLKDEDTSAQKNQEISLSTNKQAPVESIMPKICDVIPLEKDKQKLTTENLKLPAVHDATKITKNLNQQEPNDSSRTQIDKLDTSRISAGSVVRKGTTPTEIPEVDENCKKNILEKPKEINETVKAVSETRIKSSEGERSNLKIDPGKETEISSKDHKTDSNSEIPVSQKQTLDSTKPTNESQPPKRSKAKQPKLPPVPRPYNRYGLFLRPKDSPKIILESSSSEEESETESGSESESSEEEPTPVINKCSNLANGRSPDRNDKTRTRSETSNTSIYSTLSNSTTCTTFSTSSLDDEYSSPHKTPEKTLKFRKYEMDDFVFLKLLGKGSFGKVLLAELKDSEMFFAIKCLKKDVVLEDDDVESTMIERRVLALGTQHPYMCKLYCSFQTKSYLYFVMEYLNGGDLMFHIQETGRFEEKRAMFYGAEIVSALKFLHKRGIVYRDTKLDNVMLDEQGHVRLVDFGMCQCRIYKEECMPSNFCGTPAYIAPEIVLGQKYNQSVDWWSFGVLLYEMLIGRSPFQGTDEDELFWSICNEEPHYPRFLSKEAVHILGLLLVKQPSKRLGVSSCPAGDIKDHAFFSTINWDKIEKKQVPPPFKPSVSGPCDTSNFDSSFTTDSPSLSPVDSDVLKSMDQQQFHGFSYTNPHLTG